MSNNKESGQWDEPYTVGRVVPKAGKVGRLGSDNKYHVNGPQDDCIWSQGIGKTMDTSKL